MGKAQELLACVSTTAGELKCYYSPVQEHGGECIWPHTPCKRVYIRHQPKCCVWRATASLSTSGYTDIVRHYNTQIAPCRRRMRCFIAVSVFGYSQILADCTDLLRLRRYPQTSTNPQSAAAEQERLPYTYMHRRRFGKPSCKHSCALSNTSIITPIRQKRRPPPSLFLEVTK